MLEQIRHDIGMLADGHKALNEKMDRMEARLEKLETLVPKFDALIDLVRKIWRVVGKPKRKRKKRVSLR